MATVKTIDVALRANTTQFEEGLARGASVIDRFSGNTKRAMSAMDKAFHLFQKGAIQIDEYNRRIDQGEKELAAIEAGFSGMSDAVSRADSVLTGLRTETEKYHAKLKELSALKKLNILTEQQHSIAVSRTTAAYHASIPTAQLASASVDKLGMKYAGNLPIIGRFSHLVEGIATPVGAAVAALATLGIGLVAAHKAFRVVADVIGPAMARLDKSAKSADRLGMLTSEFLKLEYAAGLADVSSESLATGIQKMSRSISSAMKGTKAQVETFKELDVNVRKISALSPDKAFLVLADAIAKVENPFDRMRLTMEVFGRGGAEFINVFQGGAEAIRELGREAEKLRLPITQEDAATIQAAQDELTKLSKAFEGLGNVLAVNVAPILSEVLKDLTSGLTQPQSAVTALGTAWGSAAVQIGNQISPLVGLNQLSKKYFETVSKGAVEASNALAKQAAATKAAGAAVNPDDVLEDQQKSLADKQKLQEKLTNLSISSQKLLSAETATTAKAAKAIADSQQSTLDVQAKYLDSVANINQMQQRGLITLQKRNELLKFATSGANLSPQVKLNIKPLDDAPIKQFEARIAELQKKLEAGTLDKKSFETSVGAAKEELTKLEEIHRKRQENQAAVLDGQKTLKESQVAILNGYLKQHDALSKVVESQREAWAKLNPTLAIQDALAKRIADINALYRMQLVTLEKRNELLKVASTEATSKAQEVMVKRQVDAQSVRDSLKTPFDKFTETVAKLQDLSKSGLINPSEFQQAYADARKEAAAAIADKDPTKTFAAQDKYFSTVKSLQSRLKAGSIGIKRYTDSVGEARAQLKTALDDPLNKRMERVEGPAAIERGTAEAFSAFQKAKDPAKDEKSIAELKGIKKTLDAMAKKGLVLRASNIFG